MRSHAAIRPGSDEHAPYYAKYIARASDGDVIETLERSAAETRALLGGVDEVRAGFRYAPDKWTIREVAGHVADAERVFSYRALRFARGDQTALSAFDENAWVTQADANGRSIADLVDELAAVRGATVALFRSLTPQAWERRGVANNAEVSVRALAWIIAGHEAHHRGILRERYGL
jgi:hypothetical protein